MSTDVPGFQCRLERDGDTALVRPVGELDIATVGLVEERLEEALADGIRELVLDLSGLTFMASTGLRLVMRLVERAETGALGVSVIPGPRAVRRVFELSGVNGRVPWVES